MKIAKKMSSDEKRQVRMIGFSVLILFAIIGVIGLGTQIVKATTRSVTDKVRLNAYHSIEGDTENQILQQNEVYCRKWALETVEKTIRGERKKLSSKEKKEVQENFTTTMNTLKNGGNIQTDDKGNLTDLTKSYIANAVSQSLVEVDRSMDTKTSTDAGNTTYQQVIKLDSAVQDIMKTNDALIKLLNNGKIVAKGSSGDDYVEAKEITDLLEAEQTNLYASMFEKRGATEKTVENNEKKLTEFKEKYETVKETQVNVQEKVVELSDSVNEINTTLEKLSETSTKHSEEISVIKQNYETVNKSMQSITNEINTLKNDNKKDIEDIKNRQDSVEKKVDDMNSAMEKKFADSQDKMKEDLKKEVNAEQTKLKAEVDSMNKTMNDAIEALKKTNSNMEKSITDMQKSIDDTKTEFDSLKTEVNQLVQDEIESLQNAVDEKLKNFEEEKIKGVTDDVSVLKEQIKELEKLKNDFNNSVEKLNTYFKKLDSHAKTDIITNVTIKKDGSADKDNNVYVWEKNADNSKASVTIQNDYFKGKNVFIQVYYKDKSYSITPEYSQNETTGTLTITIKAKEVRDIVIDAIIVTREMKEAPELEKSNASIVVEPNTGDDNNNNDNNGNNTGDNEEGSSGNSGNTGSGDNNANNSGSNNNANNGEDDISSDSGNSEFTPPNGD